MAKRPPPPPKPGSTTKAPKEPKEPVVTHQAISSADDDQAVSTDSPTLDYGKIIGALQERRKEQAAQAEQNRRDAFGQAIATMGSLDSGVHGGQKTSPSLIELGRLMAGKFDDEEVV